MRTRSADCRLPPMRSRFSFAAICMALAAPTLHAQAAPISTPAAAATPLPVYDIVSIKPNKTGSGNVSVHSDDGNFEASNVSLKMLIISAYSLKESQVFNLPKWGDSARFDIKAKILEPDKKALEALNPQQEAAMQLPILDRFHLTFHHEMRTLPVYELVVVKTGAKFKETTAAEAASEEGVNGVRAGGISIHNRDLVATGITMSSFADSLSYQLHRIVVDKTGLTGKYNLTLSWAPDDGTPQAPDATLPSIFTALQEQLGLKLEPGKAPVEAFIVDHAEIPSED
jgi:uncharacterized protein (TIGR03435 family)